MPSRKYLRTFLLLTISCVICVARAVGASPLPADKAPTWVEVQTPHFLVTSDDGEKTARRIADQFEQIRYLYSQALQQGIRVDPATPIVIFAMKNESSLARIIPEYWAAKGNAHPEGLFVEGAETNYIALQSDAQGEFPYQTIYHEYIHLIVNLNFHNYPVWLNEGLAEFFSAAKIIGKSGQFGDPSAAELELLRREKLLPLDVLFKVDTHSPYYNEADKANVFYAESWALVHFLMLDPEKQNEGLLGKYEHALADGADPLAAAKTAFGDLAKLRDDLQAYVTRSTYLGYTLPLEFDKSSVTYQVRFVPPAEAEARLAQFDMDRGQLDAARPKIEDAIRLDPKLAAPQEAMGLLLYRQKNIDQADRYFERAIADGSKSALTYLYHGVCVLSQSRNGNNSDEAQAAFEKAVALNPSLDQAWANLSTLYIRYDETSEQAVKAATTAVTLAPAVPSYQYNLGLADVHARRYEDARKVAARLRASSDLESVAFADRILAQVNTAQKYSSNQVAAQEAQLARQAPAQTAAAEQSATPIIQRREDTNEPTSPSKSSTLPPGTQTVFGTRVYSMTGTISATNCNSAPEVLLTLKSLSIMMRLHGADVDKLTTVAEGTKAPPKGPVCAALKGRTAKIGYLLTNGKQWDGEIQSIELREGI